MPSTVTPQPGDSESQSQLDGPPARRLVVLVAEDDWDDPDYPRRVWSLAAPQGSPVLLLGLYSDEAERPRVHRQLASMAAIIRDSRVSVEIHTQPGRDWVQHVETVWRKGDLVVGNLQPPSRWGRPPASQVLNSSLRVPLHLLSSGRPAALPQRSIAVRLLSWVGSLGIIGGFLWLQISLGRLPSGLGPMVLFALTILAEVGLLWIWNSLTA